MKKLLASCAAAALAITLVGCANNTEAEPEPETAPAEEEVTYTIVGEQADGFDEVLTTNNLGQAITTLTLKAPDAAEASANLVAAGTTIAANEQFLLCFEPVGGANVSDDTSDEGDASDEGATEETTFASASSDTSDDRAAKLLYEMTVTLEGGATYTLPGLALETYEKMELVMSNGLASVTYTTLDGATGDTAQASADAAAQAQAAADAAAQAAAEQERQASSAAAVVEEDYDVDYGYSGSTSSSGSGSSTSSGTSSSGYGAGSGTGNGSSAGSSGSGSSADSSGGSSAGSGSGSSPSQNQDSCIDPDDMILK